MTLLYTKDNSIMQRDIYKDVVRKMITFYKYQETINTEKREDKCSYSQKKENYSALYKSFYDSCRNDFLVLKDKGKNVSKDIIIDCCILCCYTDKYFINKLTVFNLLWNMFPEELIQRSKGNFGRRKYDQQQLDAFAETVNKKLKQSIRQFKNENEKMRLNRLKEIPCLQPVRNKKGEDINTGDIIIYKDSISAIKRLIPTSEDDYINKRKLLYVLYVMQKKVAALSGKENQYIPFQEKSEVRINYSIIAEILGIDGKKVKCLMNWLEGKGLIGINPLKKGLDVYGGIEDGADMTITYYDGSSYLSAFKLMNRYLSR